MKTHRTGGVWQKALEHRGRLAYALPMLLPAAAWGAASPHVVLDGSLNKGGATPLQPVANIYSVRETVGRQVGSNLFESFGLLNPGKGETVSFSGPSSIHNMLVRVTGGPSAINGTLQCTIPSANFFLVNPAGVVFGPDAKLDVQGSFAVTTANYLRLSDGAKFTATASAADNLLTSAPPAAFGFLGKPAPIALQGAAPAAGATPTPADLAVASGNALSLVGGDITITNGSLVAPGGRVNVFSAASAGELTLDATSAAALMQPAGFGALGAVTVSAGSTFMVTGAGGAVAMRGGALNWSDSSIAAENNGPMPSGGVDIEIAGPLAMSNSKVLTPTVSTGRGGDITLIGSNVSLDATLLEAQSASTASGDGGNVLIQATQGGPITLTGRSSVSTASVSRGNSGAVGLDGGAVTLQDSQVTTDINSLNPAARGGDIAIHAGSLIETGNSNISASADAGNATGGDINIQAGTAMLDASGTAGGVEFGISAFPAGNTVGGSIHVAVNGMLQLLGGATLGATTGSSRSSGNTAVAVTAGTLLIDGKGSPGQTGIIAEVLGGGDGPPVQVRAGELTIRAGGEIGTSTFGRGKAGPIDVSVTGALTLDSQGINESSTGNLTGILAVAEGAGAADDGAGGNIQVHAATVSIVNGAEVSADTSGGGRGGIVNINATGALTVGGANNSSLFTGISATSESLVSARGGGVNLTAGQISVEGAGVITAATVGNGAGGDITIVASTASLTDPGSIIGAQSGGAGAGGNVTITAGRLSIENGALVAANAFAAGAGGKISVNADDINLNGQGYLGATGLQSSSTGMAPSSTAGSVTVATGTMEMLAGGSIHADAGGLGDGRPLQVTASKQITIDGTGQARQSLTGIFADALFDGPENAGKITLVSPQLRIVHGGLISSSTAGNGNGGGVDIQASSILLDGSLAAGNTGIQAVAASPDSGAAGQAGDIDIATGTLRIVSGAGIAASTLGNGDAGAISISARTLAIDGAGSASPAADPTSHVRPVLVHDDSTTFFTGISDSTLLGKGSSKDIQLRTGRLRLAGGAVISAGTSGPGNGGSITIDNSGAMRLSGGSSVSATTLGAGKAGSVHVHTGRLVVEGAGTTLESASMGSGDAGIVDATATGPLTVLNGGSIKASAGTSAGGNVSLFSRTRVAVVKATVTAQSGSTGGNITARSEGVIQLEDSTITANAGGAGGAIRLGNPGAATVLNGGLIDGRSRGRPVKVEIDGVLLRQGGIIRTNTPQTFPIFDLAGALAPLRTSFGLDVRPLPAICGIKLGSIVSSFIVTGRGGSPPEPGGWQPDHNDDPWRLDLRPPH